VVTRRLAKPRPVQGEAGSDEVARRGTGYAARAAGQPAAERDGHPRQNPAYRPATEKALVTGLFLWTDRWRLVRLAPRRPDCRLRGTPARSSGVASGPCGYESHQRQTARLGSATEFSVRRDDRGSLAAKPIPGGPHVQGCRVKGHLSSHCTFYKSPTLLNSLTLGTVRPGTPLRPTRAGLDQ